jgi:multiple sugar transport system permease protein
VRVALEARAPGGERSAARRLLLDRLLAAKVWFLLPAVVWTCGFTLFPLCYALWLSLQQSRGMGRPLEFAGLKGYARLFGDQRVWDSLTFTLGYAAVTVAVEMLLGLALALLVNREFRLRGLVRTLLMLPLFATPVGLGYLGRIIYADNGPINVALSALFGGGISWMSSPWSARLAVGLLDVWQWTPFCFLILLAGLQSIPDDLYEAARLDTNRRLEVLWHITLPLLRPLLALTLLLRLVEALKIIDIPFALTAGGPGRANETFSLFIYRAAFTGFDIGFASAASFLFLIVVLMVVNTLVLLGRFRTGWEAGAVR